MTDIPALVERLRDNYEALRGPDYYEAADALERLEKRCAALTAAVIDARDHIRSCFGTDENPGSDSAAIVDQCIAALAEGEQK